MRISLRVMSLLDLQKIKVLSLPERIKETSTFRAKALRRELAFARNIDFSFIVSGSERTFTFRVSLNTLPTLATLVRVLLDLGYRTVLHREQHAS